MAFKGACAQISGTCITLHGKKDPTDSLGWGHGDGRLSWIFGGTHLVTQALGNRRESLVGAEKGGEAAAAGLEEEGA